MRAARLLASTTLTCCAALAACSGGSGSSAANDGSPAATNGGPGATPASANSAAAGPTVRGAAAFVRETQPWQFDGAAGQIVRTEHFRIYTTVKSPAILERLPGYMELALQNYVSAVVPLDYPDTPMESFVMNTRPQWQNVSLQMLGPRAQPLIQIRRGGFATMGRGFYFDIGVFDTLAVAGHEGWHQFMQRTFREQLPLWLEEGMATFMEGHRWEGGTPRFLPWANVERFDRLREVVAKKELLSVGDLLSASSDQLIGGGGTGVGLTYYAQLWALMHFLNEGEGGRHRANLQRMVTDAAAGRLSPTVAAALGPQANRPLARAIGATVFMAYIDRDPARLNVEYQAFIKQLTSVGGREAIVEGRSPITAAR